MYFIGGIIVWLGVAIGFILKGAPLIMFVNPAVVGLILFAIIGVIVATSGQKTFIRGLNAALSREYVIDDEERRKAADLYRLLSKTAIMASVIGLLIGIITILTNITALKVDNVELFSHSLAAAIISPVFGLILAVAFFEPAVYVLKKPRATSSLVKEYPQHLGDRLLEMCSQNGMTTEDIQNATRIELKRD